MNAYLTRLGIRPGIQEWMEPWYHIDDQGNLCFSYGNDTEVYGLAFHRVPLSGLWTTGNSLTRYVIICSSAMEAISWLNCNLSAFHSIDQIMLAAIGNIPSLAQLKQSPGAKYQLVFGNDLPSHLWDLKVAAHLAGHPVNISIANDAVEIIFRHQRFYIPCETFSLSAFERLSGYRFNVRTSKPTQHSSWLTQLLNTNL